LQEIAPQHAPIPFLSDHAPLVVSVGCTSLQFAALADRLPLAARERDAKSCMHALKHVEVRNRVRRVCCRRDDDGPDEFAAHECQLGHARERGGKIKRMRRDGLVCIRVKDVEVVWLVYHIIYQRRTTMGNSDGAVDLCVLSEDGGRLWGCRSGADRRTRLGELNTR